MIVIRLELWPKGDESRKRVLGVGVGVTKGGTNLNIKSDDDGSAEVPE